MTWKLMPKYKHQEWRIGYFLLCIECAGQDPDEGEWWNWNIQARKDDDVVTDERYEVEAGGAKTEAEAKSACEEAARRVVQAMHEQLSSDNEASVTGRAIELYGHTWLLIERQYCSEDHATVGYSAVQCHSNGRVRLPAVIHYVELPAEALRGHDG